MSVRIECPEGHLFDIDVSKLDGAVVCPCCFAVFMAGVAFGPACHARPEKGKAGRPRDDDDDKEKPVKKKADAIKPGKAPANAKSSKSKRDEDVDEEEDEEDEDDEDEEDEDEEDDEDEDEEEEAPIKWTTKKRQLTKLKASLKALMVTFKTMLVLMGLDSLSLVFAVLIGFSLFFQDPPGPGVTNTFGSEIVMLYGMTGAFLGGPCLTIMYGAQVVAWIMGLMGPGKSGSRGIAMTSLVLFFTPVLLFMFYFILMAILKPRAEVADRLFYMILGIAGVCAFLAFYCSLVSIGGVAGYMNLTTEKSKPSALGWFIVGGPGMRMLGAIGAIGMLAMSPGMVGVIVLFVTIGLTLVAYWFALNSLRELFGVMRIVQDSIDTFIRDG